MPANKELSYNSSQPHLVLPEYGRNIQKMVDFAMTVKNKDERNKVAQAIIAVMGQLNPHLRDVVDFKHKLWDHIFIISDFKLDVDSPYPLPTRKTFETKPDILKYPTGKIKYKHYGKTVEAIIEKAKTYKVGEEKTYLVEVVANMMKRMYLNWNRDSVNDEVIIKHLAELSDGKLKLEDVSKLSHTSELLSRTPANRENSGGSGGGRHHRRNDKGGHRHKGGHSGKNNNHRRGGGGGGYSRDR